MKRFLLTALVVLRFLTITHAPKAAAPDSDYIFCSLTDISGSKVVYYSDVFVGDSSVGTKYALAFDAHVKGKYSGVVGNAQFYFTQDLHKARKKEDDMRAQDRLLGKRIINTRWTYRKETMEDLKNEGYDVVGMRYTRRSEAGWAKPSIGKSTN